MMEPLDFRRGNQKIAVLGDELVAHRMARKADRDAPGRQHYTTAQIASAVCVAGGMAEQAAFDARRVAAVDVRTAARCVEGTAAALGMRALAVLENASMHACPPGGGVRRQGRDQSAA